MLRERWDALLASHLGVLASVAALRNARSWLDAAVAQIDANASRAAGAAGRSALAIGYRKPQASFLAWLDCRELGLGDDPAAVFLERGRVALSYGPDFGAQGRGFARLNMGTSPELLAEAVRRMGVGGHRIARAAADIAGYRGAGGTICSHARQRPRRHRAGRDEPGPAAGRVRSRQRPRPGRP